MGKILTLASDEELEDLALELGATVERSDGGVFNAAGRKVVRLRRRNERPEPAPPPPPAPAPLDLAPLMEKIGELVTAVVDSRTVKVEEKVVEVKVPVPAPAPPPQVVVQQVRQEVLSWTFNVERGTMGLAKKIIATPVLGPKDATPYPQVSGWSFEFERGPANLASRILATPMLPKGAPRVPAKVFEMQRNQSGELMRITTR